MFWCVIFLSIGMGFSHTLAQDVIKFCKVTEIGEGSFDLDPRKNFVWSSDGQSIAILTHGEVEVWDTSLSKLRYVLQKDSLDAYIMDFAWSSDSSKIAIATDLGVMVFDAQTGISYLKWKPSNENEEVHFIDWKPNDEWIAIRTFKNVIIWDISNDTIIHEQSVSSSFSDPLSWSPDGLYLAFSSAYKVNIWNSEKAKIEQSFEIGNNADTLLWSPDGTQIVINRIVLGVAIFDPSTGHKIANLDAIEPFVWIDANNLLTGFGLDPTRYLVMWNTKTWQQTSNVEIEDRTYSPFIALKPDTTTIAIPIKIGTSLIMANLC
jgi:uncharacterized protein with WD repeat